MITLGIETSCDETSIALLETTTSGDTTTYRILAHHIFSQIDIHAEYGGVFPVLAKREHARRLVPMLEVALHESKLAQTPIQSNIENATSTIKTTLTSILSEKEPDLLATFLTSSLIHNKPTVDRIAVTYGPGLEPALWVGVNFARALSTIWNIPIYPVNHMEGHIVGSLLTEVVPHTEHTLKPLPLPAVALLISGGHTELVKVNELSTNTIGGYTILGATQDDAVGEAYDKVARMMNLPYPGGPVIAQLAEKARERLSSTHSKNPVTFPRPMLHSPDLSFSFSGLKTAVLYFIEKNKKTSGDSLTPEMIESIALAFEDAVTEVLVEKTRKALGTHEAHALVVGGGVIANKHICSALDTLTTSLDIPLFLPPKSISGDNALMIALAGSLHKEKVAEHSTTLSAQGNLSLE